MQRLLRGAVAILTAAVCVAGTAAPAAAKCKRMGFLVNDYGKDGPTKDAIELLDKHVAKWAGEQGIKNYTIGKKDVKCELYLNLILFDEHTCTASANVCWDEGPASAKPAAAATGGDGATGEAKKAEKKSATDGKPDAKDGATAKSDTPAVNEAVPSGASPVETGAVPADTKPDASTAAPVAVDPAAAEKAAAAAERAAEAAERAAAAAERAAQAAAEKYAPAAAAPPASVPEVSAVSPPTAPAGAATADAVAPAAVAPVLPSVPKP